MKAILLYNVSVIVKHKIKDILAGHLDMPLTALF